MKNLIVVKENNGQLHIVSADFFSLQPMSECYGRYGEKVSAYDAGDYLTLLTQAAADMANDIYNEDCDRDDEEFVARFAVGDTVSAYDDEEIFDNLVDEEGVEVERTLVKGYTYWDGHNFRTLILDNDYGETDLERIDEDEERRIIAAYRRANFKDTSHGIRTATGKKYKFIESDFQGSWEIATVEII